MYWYEKTISERGIPNDIYHYLTPDDAPDEFEQFLWCDKVGGKVFCFGKCSDAYSNQNQKINHIPSKKKRRNKRERDLKYKKHLEMLWEQRNIIGYRPSIYVEDNAYYKRLTPNHGGKLRRMLKKCSNKKVRQYKGDIPNGSGYKKVIDYKWTLN